MAEFVEHLKQNVEVARYKLFHDIIEKEADLEFLLEELQDLVKKEYLNYAFSTPYSDLPPPPPDLEQPLREEQNFQDLAAAAYRLKKLIENEVYLHYRGFDDEEKVKLHFQPLFQLVASELDSSEIPIVVFTTNYDRGIEIFCEQSSDYKLFDGFSLDGNRGEWEWSRTAFQRYQPEKNKKNIVLFKLHGSTKWFRSGKRIIKGLEVLANNDQLYTNLLIYPAMRKIAIDEPYFTSYDFLQKCLSHAKVFLVLGYSFRDQDALTRTRSATHTNSELKMAIVSPDAKKLTTRLKQSEIQAKPIPGSYGPFEVSAPFGRPGKPILDNIQQFLQEALGERW